MLKAANTLIAWNGIDKHNSKAPPGSIAIGPLQEMHELDWTAPYECTGGAAYVERRTMFGMIQRHRVMLDWYQLVYVYGINPYVVHRAFLLIDEYQALIKDAGFGPAKDEPGHDPDAPYGRAVAYPVPTLKIFTAGRSTHFWPKAESEIHAAVKHA
jgi:hypothetical protein